MTTAHANADRGGQAATAATTILPRPDRHEEDGTMIADRYEYPANGRYNETIAVMADGTRHTVNTQYRRVNPRGEHSPTCGIRRMGGVCDCGRLDGIDVDALLAEAREHGKFGQEPKSAPSAPLAKDSEICRASEELMRRMDDPDSDL